MSKSELSYWRSSSFYINPTSRCINDCLFCVRNFGDGVFGFNLVFKEEPTATLLIDAIDNTWDSEYDDVLLLALENPCSILMQSYRQS